MEIPKIIALVPAGEHFDQSAIINEGGFLSVAHIGAIENALGEDNAEALAQANEQITTLTSERDAAQSSLDATTEQLNTANETITARDARIVELEAEVAEFASKGSGGGSVLNTGADPVDEVEERKGALSAEHPVNKAVQAKVNASKNKKKYKRN